MIIEPDTKEKVIEHTRYWINKANAALGLDLPMPSVDFDQRGAIAGQTFLTRNDETGEIVSTRISFNPYYVQQDYMNFMENIIPHEVAHLMQFAQHPKSKQHGIEWIQIMKNLGVRPEIYTDVHVENPVSKPKGLHLYQCVECGAKKVFGTKQHRSFELKHKLPECEKCGGVMEHVRSAEI